MKNKSSDFMSCRIFYVVGGGLLCKREKLKTNIHSCLKYSMVIQVLVKQS